MVFARVPEVLPDQQEIRSEGSKKEKIVLSCVEKSAGSNQIKSVAEFFQSLQARDRVIILIVKDDTIKKNNLSLYY
jgi:hypothetical protein